MAISIMIKTKKIKIREHFKYLKEKELRSDDLNLNDYSL